MSRRRASLVLFAKAPRRGTVKRRLAADGIGEAAALRFHRQNAQALIRRLADGPSWRTYLFLTPDRSASGPPPWRGLPHDRIRPQGHGDLGRRMERALGSLPPPVLICGTDIPGIDRGHVARAVKALRRGADLVFGPAHDGGFWLVGTRRPVIGRVFARKTRWSSEHALADAVAAQPPARRVVLVDRLEDVDDAASWRRWRAAAATRGSYSPGA